MLHMKKMVQNTNKRPKIFVLAEINFIKYQILGIHGINLSKIKENFANKFQKIVIRIIEATTLKNILLIKLFYPS